jgi:hypothetical protein
MAKQQHQFMTLADVLEAAKRSPDDKAQPRKVRARAVAVVPVTAEDRDCAGDWQARRVIMRVRFG